MKSMSESPTPDTALAPMTDEEIDQIEALADAASKGPWELQGGNEWLSPLGLDIGNEDWGSISAKDADFIIAARTDVPRLARLAREQRATLARATELINTLMVELGGREEDSRKAYVAGELTHGEASSSALEDRYAVARLATIRAVLAGKELS